MELTERNVPGSYTQLRSQGTPLPLAEKEEKKKTKKKKKRTSLSPAHVVVFNWFKSMSNKPIMIYGFRALILQCIVSFFATKRSIISKTLTQRLLIIKAHVLVIFPDYYWWCVCARQMGVLQAVVGRNIHPHISLSHQAAVVMKSSFLYSSPPPPPFPPQTLLRLITQTMKLPHIYNDV